VTTSWSQIEAILKVNSLSEVEIALAKDAIGEIAPRSSTVSVKDVYDGIWKIEDKL